MVFSSTLFLFLFLPLALASHFVLPRRWRNLQLLAVSLLFYGWGEPVMVAAMLASIGVSFAFGLGVDGAGRRGTVMVALAVALNLALLALFKYSDWVIAALADGFGWQFPRPADLVPSDSPWYGILFTSADTLRLPIGISFFTFQAMSYVIDVHRGAAAKQKNPLDLALYISFFPQLIAGPIVRYQDVADQIRARAVTRAGFSYGIGRFVMGLGKKVLIANVCAEAADAIFALEPAQLPAGTAWLGIACYTLQIYFDFSGYSDMAIGLAHLFGFRFRENFEHPYVSRSITEFWRRWHISLSTWFRDYLYVPLGGNRAGRVRTGLNLLAVFLLCGLWHGASTTFVVWGLCHGAFLVLERIGLKRLLERAGPLRHGYVLLAVMVGWVFFRAESLPHAFAYLGALFGGTAGDPLRFGAWHWLDAPLAAALLCGIVGATPWLRSLEARCAAHPLTPARRAALEWAALAGLALVFVASVAVLSAGTYNPFIYFRF